jgi:competence protein CoiA
MELATDSAGGRIVANPTQRATCPACGGTVIAKCGEIVVWHWAHESLKDCDAWSEGESEWHRDWKACVPSRQREVVIGRHRADIQLDDGMVYELQHSSISTQEIREREDFYGRMAWIFDCREPYENDRLRIRAPRPDRRTPNYRTFRWAHVRKSIAACRRTVYLDLGEDVLLRLGKLYLDGYPGGYGFLVSNPLPPLPVAPPMGYPDALHEATVTRELVWV